MSMTNSTGTVASMNARKTSLQMRTGRRRIRSTQTPTTKNSTMGSLASAPSTPISATEAFSHR
jgi:hypothetical protein